MRSKLIRTLISNIRRFFTSLFQRSKKLRSKEALMNTFFTIQSRLLLKRSNRESFSQIIGEHANSLIQLIKTDSKRQIMTLTLQIDELINEWIYLITRSDRPDSEFAKTTDQLIHHYNDLLCDYIMDVFNVECKKKIVEVVKLEAKFFDMLGSSSSLAQWVAYTGSIVYLTEVYSKFGAESERFYVAASDALRNGSLLGNTIDAQLRINRR